MNGKDDIAEYVKLFTEIQGDPPTAPFHWREWNDDEGAGKITKKVSFLDYLPFVAFLTPYISILKGCLQNELIIYTLAHAHFAEYEDIPDPHNLDSSELPGGALVLAMQAVNFALHLTCQHYANSVSVFFRSNMLSNFGKPGNLLRIKPPISLQTIMATLSKGRLALTGE